MEYEARPDVKGGPLVRVFARLKWQAAKVERLGLKVLQRMEHLLLAAGLALVLLYVSARIHAVVMYQAGLWSFAALRPGLPAAKDDGEQLRGVDFSLWSGNRVRAYA
jgi:hypothetical protein